MSTNNAAFARRMANIADALAYYDHLPHIGLVTVTPGSIFLAPDAGGHEGIIAVARWAEAFSVPVELSASPNHEIRTTVQLAGMLDVHVYVNLASQQTHELAVRLDQAMTADGVEVSAAQLLAALHVEPVTAPAAGVEAASAVNA